MIHLPIRPVHVTAFVFAIAFAIVMHFLSREAVSGSFEVSHPAYWTGFEFYYRLACVFGPPLIIGLVFPRRAGFVAGAAAAIVYTCLAWPEREALYTGEIKLRVWRDFALDGLLYTVLPALLAALVSWLRFKWFPRSRFGALKWWQIVLFFTLIVTGGRAFIEGTQGLREEHLLSTAGKHARVTNMYMAMGEDDVATLKDDAGKEYSVENTATPRLRDRFERGEEVSVRYLPDGPFISIYSWEGEDRSGLVLASWAYVGAGLVCMGLGMVFGWRLRGLLRKSDGEQFAASNT